MNVLPVRYPVVFWGARGHVGAGSLIYSQIPYCSPVSGTMDADMPTSAGEALEQERAVLDFRIYPLRFSSIARESIYFPQG